MVVLVKIATGVYSFRCPGCDAYHQYWVQGEYMDPEHPQHPSWHFNGNMERPTFTPSLLNTWGKQADPTWEEPAEPSGDLPWSGRCHLFLTDGVLQYCGDCTHKLAGASVPLLPLPEHFYSQYLELNPHIKI